MITSLSEAQTQLELALRECSTQRIWFWRGYRNGLYAARVAATSTPSGHGPSPILRDPSLDGDGHLVRGTE